MGTTRVTGIVSGFDTEQLVTDLMKVETTRLDNVKKQRQKVEWTQDAYREIITSMRNLQNKYFNTLKPSSNIASSSSFAQFSYSVKSNGVATSAVSVVASASSAKSAVIDKITQLASKDTWSGNSVDLRGIETEGFDLATFKSGLSGKDFEVSMVVGSSSKKIKVTQSELASITTTDELKTKLNEKIGAAFGSEFQDVVSVTAGGELKFDKVGSTIKLMTYDTNTESMSALGFGSSVSSVDYKSKSLSDLFGVTASDLTGVQINGVDISLSETDTIDTMLSKINNSGAGVTMTYNSLTDAFVMKSNKDGTANNVSVETGSAADAFLSKLFNVTDLSDSSLNRVEGKNALLSINGVEVVQSSNSFALDGIGFTLNSVSAQAIDINVSVDSSSMVTNISNFVKEYNELIDSIYSKYTEAYDRDYQPLTDDEKDAMTEDEVTKWEAKAKKGLLKGASELDSFLTAVRNAMVDPIEGVNIRLSDIGISSSSYLDHGKLTVNEEKLKSSVESKYDDVVALFSSKSSYSATDTANSANRYKQNGIGNRLDDILDTYVTTTRDSKGKKGILLEKAGMLNDTSLSSNELKSKLDDYDDRISDLTVYLADLEERYYSQFTAMETALANMQAQSNSLASMLG